MADKKIDKGDKNKSPEISPETLYGEREKDILSQPKNEDVYYKDKQP